MKKAKWFPILVAVVATALFVLPGLAFGGGGGGNNGTPSPPPSNPPCDADGHGGSPPPYGGPNKNTGSCDHGGATGNACPPASPKGEGDPPCGTTGTTGSSSSSSSSSSSTSTSTSTSTSSSSSSTSTSTSTASSSSTTTADVCETDGVLGTKGLGINAGDDRTIGQIVWDELGLVVQDPQIPGDGPLSQPLYDGLLMIPLGGLETPIAAEVGCLLNNLSL